MPRRPRVVLPGVPLHLIQRGNNRQACFYAEDDYRFYLEWLRTYARDTGCMARGKSKMAALGAAMRKLVHLCFGVIKTRTPYQADYLISA